MEATYNPETKKFAMQGEQKAEKGKKTYSPMYRVNGTQLEKLLKFAEADGFPMKNAKGKADNWKIGNAVKVMVNQIINEWITQREAV